MEMIFIFIFIIGIAGILIRKNIIMTLLCCFLSYSGALLLLNSVLNQSSNAGETVILPIVVVMFLYSLLGLLLIAVYFKESNNIMNEKIKFENR